jgi:ubiquinone/menaquinone biosynthesis C-methylase UbiE
MPDILTQQQNVSAAFSKQSTVFDDLDKGNAIITWMRNKVRQHVLSIWKFGEHVLELNAGTGLDAAFFAEKGMHVHATDDAEGMIAELKKKASDRITVERCSFLDLNKLQNHQFNHIFSNFGGLNCTDKLDVVIKSFSNLLKPGGTATLVIMPPLCPWEMAKALKGNFKVAFRRLKKGGALSNVEGVSFNSYYYSPKRVAKMFGKQYRVIAIESLGSLVPPPYMERFPAKYPNMFKALTSLENSVGNAWPFYAWADHFIITMQKLA